MAVTTAMAIAAAAPAVSGVLGRMLSAGDRKKANQLAEDAYAEIERLGLPPDQSIELMLEKFKSAGIYTPELENEIKQTVSKTAEIKEDPNLKDAQMRALEMMQQTGRTGLNATDRAALNQIRQEVQRDSEAKRQQIMQSMQARGQAGGGAELAASLLSAQAGADQQSEAGDRIATQAQERALQAMMQSGQLGGQVRGQDLDYNKTVAEAADEMERFNIQNAVNRQQRNVGSKNQAQEMNLRQQQEMMNANVAMANAEKQRQSQAARQYYQDMSARAQAKANARLGQANIKSGQAADTAKMVQGIGSGLGAAAGAYANRPAAPAPAGMTQTQAGIDYMKMTDDEEFGRK